MLVPLAFSKKVLALPMFRQENFYLCFLICLSSSLGCDDRCRSCAVNETLGKRHTHVGTERPVALKHEESEDPT